MMFFSLMIYTLFVTMIFTCRTYIPYLLALLIVNCHSMSIFCVSLDTFCIKLEKTMKKNILMRKSVSDKTLVQCQNVDTYVIDGRNRPLHCNTELCLENRKVYCIVDNNVDSEKV